MPNSLSVHQFKEEYQKLEQQSNKINKDIENLFYQKINEVTSTILELKKVNFVFTHPSNNTLRTRHGAIVGFDSQYLHVYIANGNPLIYLVNRATDSILSGNNTTFFLNNFIHQCDVVFAFDGLELEEQMRNCLTSLEEQNKQRLQLLDSRLNSNS